MDKLGASDEVLEAPMLNKAVERAQKKVEENNFSIRKRLLEYDDVMNQQREVIYDRRKFALVGERMKGDVLGYFEDTVDGLLDEHFPEEMPTIIEEIRKKFLIDIDVRDAETAEQTGRDDVRRKIVETGREFYAKKEESVGPEFMANIERFATLHVIDDKWREHLREMDDLKQAIGLRAYAQRDPLVEYKKEGYEMFVLLINDINTEIASFAFKYFPQQRADQQRTPTRSQRRQRGLYATKRDRMAAAERDGTGRQLNYSHSDSTNMGLGSGGEAPTTDPNVAAATGAAPGSARQNPNAAQPTVQREEPKIGRNDPCWCGSGKKYKHCHGRS
jgi:preprotein translocase subunit SecA